MSAPDSSVRRRLRPLGLLLLIAAFAVLLVFVANLSWFDEPLLPEIEALRKSPAVSLEGNGYPFALGFLASRDRDPHAVGVAIIAALQERRDRGEPAKLDSEEMRAMLGAPLANDGLDATLGFHCQARHFTDCPDRLRARLPSLGVDDLRLGVLFARHQALLGQPHFLETPQPDLQTPSPPFGPIVALGRLRLALSFRDDATSVFLDEAARELGFWRVVLREGESLSTKMVALAAIRNTHDFLSALLRERVLDADDLEHLRAIVRPFSREETNIGAAFDSGLRAYLLSDEPPDSLDSSWANRLALQKNATFNQQYRGIVGPMRERSSLSAPEFNESKAYLPIRHDLRMTPALIYNFAGKLAFARSAWDPQQFPSRVHDEEGRVELILLQAEIEAQPDSDVPTLITSSKHRNLYTGAAMEYDARARTIWFECRHTAFHPPEPADHCAVDIGPATSGP